MPSLNGKWNVVGDYDVEIWFPIDKDTDGYPKSKDWEQLLARPLEEGVEYFRLESVPFFLKNVSRGDIVQAAIVKDSQISEQETFRFHRLVDRGGHNTYRLLLKQKRSSDPAETVAELLARGLAVEEDEDLLAVDVPPSVDQLEIDRYLVCETERGRWEMQDGCLQGIKTEEID